MLWIHLLCTITQLQLESVTKSNWAKLSLWLAAGPDHLLPTRGRQIVPDMSEDMQFDSCECEVAINDIRTIFGIAVLSLWWTGPDNMLLTIDVHFCPGGVNPT